MLSPAADGHDTTVFPHPATNPHRAATPTKAFPNYVPILFYPASSFFVPQINTVFQLGNRNAMAPERI